MKNIYRFYVYNRDGADSGCVGSVCLPIQAQEHHVGHALAAVGIYAPRGADHLVWEDEPSGPVAFIFDGDGEEIVRLVMSHIDAP